MVTPMEVVTLRLPVPQLERLRARAGRRDLYLADVLRAYIEAGDKADTRRESKETN